MPGLYAHRCRRRVGVTQLCLRQAAALLRPAHVNRRARLRDLGRRHGGGAVGVRRGGRLGRRLRGHLDETLADEVAGVQDLRASRLVSTAFSDPIPTLGAAS